MANNLENLEEQLNYQFSNQELVRRALTHRSANKLNNERLEFLGDSLLGYIVAETLFSIYPDAKEGMLSRLRAGIVNKEALAEIARELQLGKYVQLGQGELNSGGRERDSILADTVEALIAAIYLDGGIEACTEFVRFWCERKLATLDTEQQKDSKTLLQELMQSQGKPLPQYQVLDISGEAHQQSFRVSCQVASLNKVEYGEGRSKRIAEQAAAGNVLNQLDKSS